MVATTEKRVPVVVRMARWQKADLEAEAQKQNRSLNNFILNELGKRRKWKDRRPEDGQVIPPG